MLWRNRELRIGRVTEQNPAELEQRPLSQSHAIEDAPNDAILKGEDPVQVVHRSVEHVHGPEEVPYAEDELVLVCLVRDGRPYIKSFVEHHTSMGVKHMFFLDNGSTDGTVEALKQYGNVSVLRTALPYADYHLSIVQYLVERFGQESRWCLCVDIDELFDYPYSDVVGLDSFLGYLNSNSYTAVVAQVLDMLPEEPLLGRAGNPDEPLKERHRFYDVSNLKRISIKEHPLTSINNTNNTYESDDIEFFTGGTLETLIDGHAVWLTRWAPTFSDGRVKPFVDYFHRVDNARVADLTCVLFHYRFLDEYFHKKVAQAVREEHYAGDASQRYKRYLEVLENAPSLQLKRESARELRSVNDLVDNQFLVVSEEYMMLVYDQARKKGAGRALRRGEPDGPGDEAASDRTWARAQVQNLRAKRLEQRLEELTEQHQRELEKLGELHQRHLENRLEDLRKNNLRELEDLREDSRKAKKRALEKLREQDKRKVEELQEQNKRKVEKLSRRLHRAKEKTRKQNRNLARQLRIMRASRGWRLLNKLGSLRARVLGKKPHR
jgi:uncharacterized protein with PIN domain